MAKNKFTKFAAVMRNSGGSNVVVCRWKNIPMLRYRRRTTTSYRRSLIKRVPLNEGIEFILDHYGENTALDNYPNLGFHKFFHDEMERLKGYFNTIAPDNTNYGLTVEGMQHHLPTWFVDFVIQMVPQSKDDMNMWVSYRKFYDSYYQKTSNVFYEHSAVKAFFYTRFESSLNGTLAADVISYVRPRPAYKQSSWGGDIDEYKYSMYNMGSDRMQEYVNMVRNSHLYISPNTRSSSSFYGDPLR